MNKEKLEKKLLEYIDENEVVKIAQNLIKIPSENPPGNLKEVSNYVCSFLEKNFLEYQVKEAKEGFPIIISTLEGEIPGKTLILNGHLDVVPAGELDKWDYPPYSGIIEEGYLHGRGTSDMKAGVAGLLAAFKAASKIKDLPGKIILLLVSDEETGGHWGSKWIMEEENYQADGCLIAEPSKSNPTIGQKGACWLKLISHGIPGHGSLSPAAGDNAIIKMNKAISAIYEIWNEEWKMPEEIIDILNQSKNHAKNKKEISNIERVFDHVSINVGVIKGGDKVNKIPDYCEAEIDMRVPFGVKSSEVINWITNKLKNENLDIEIESLRWNSEANYTNPDNEIVDSVVNSAIKHGIKDVKPLLQWASSDARYFREKGIPTIQFGPAEYEGIHSYNEKVSIEEIKLYSKIYGSIIFDFLTS